MPRKAAERCIACRTLGDRRCWKEHCFWAPYFPYGQKEEEFSMMHEIFDADFVRATLYRIPDNTQEGKEQRHKAVESFVWEARIWKENPAFPPLAHFLSAVERVKELQSNINNIISFKTEPFIKPYELQVEDFQGSTGTLNMKIEPPVYNA
ncbi:LOB domain-containing protein 17-like [Tripterygium wilfordii]|uniref:LOB domain-containing protein 17-like n=1 Tax=Tripterygium wilfordii TaxID=458696 RepID=UPI0018F85228|nr:LOB domain-containing protein 17-like [Tripterygium wilfordii]